MTPDGLSPDELALPTLPVHTDGGVPSTHMLNMVAPHTAVDWHRQGLPVWRSVMGRRRFWAPAWLCSLQAANPLGVVEQRLLAAHLDEAEAVHALGGFGAVHTWLRALHKRDVDAWWAQLGASPRKGYLR